MSRLFLTLVCAVGCAQLVFAFSVAQSSSSESKTTLYYGFAGQDAAPEYRGKFVRVESRNHNTDVSCERIGLRPSDELTNIGGFGHENFGEQTSWIYDFESFHNIDYKDVVGGYLTAGITDFRVYNFPYTYVDWMSRLADDSPLTALALPGSHISGSAQKLMRYYSVETQQYSVIFQLMLGVRVLDIRPMRSSKVRNILFMDDGNYLWTYSIFEEGTEKVFVPTERLDRIVNCVKMFLESYPTETVIFKASEYVSTTEDELVRELAAALGDRFVNPPTRQAKQALRVGDVRGKVLFLPIEQTESNFGPNGKAGTNNWNDLLAHLERIPERRDVFNFFPALFKSQSSSYPKSPSFMAWETVMELTDWLQTSASDKIGIIETDYFGLPKRISELIGGIVKKNGKLGFLRDN